MKNGRILNVDCNINSSEGILSTIESLAYKTLMNQPHVFPHETVIWNNNYIFDRALRLKFPNLNHLINWGTDTSNITAVMPEVTISTTKGYATTTVADFIIKQIISNFLPEELKHLSLGFLGFGRIGQTVARKMRLLVESIKFATPSVKYFGDKFIQDSRLGVIGSDIIIVCADTADLLLKATDLTVVKSSKFVINVSRENTVDPRFINGLLSKGWLQGYVSDNYTKLDVYDCGGCSFTGHTVYKSDISKKNKIKKLQFLLARQKFKMEKRNVWIARHGETQWNVEGRMQGSLNSDLTQTGIEQAKKLAMFFKDRSLSIIFHSPLDRCRDTAHIIEKITGVSLCEIPEMREMNFGDFQGCLKDEVESNPFFEQRKKDKLRTPYPNGESYLDVFSRLEVPVEEAFAKVGSGDVLFIGHESLNRMIEPVLSNMFLEDAVNHRQKNTEIVKLDLALAKRNIYEI